MEEPIQILSLKSGRLKFKSAESTPNFSSPYQRSKRPINEQQILSTPKLQNVDQLAPPSPRSPIEDREQVLAIGGGGAPLQVRKIFDSSAVDVEGPECLLIHEKDTPRIYFKIPDQEAKKKLGKNTICVLQCADISAADLRVTSKFGSWDSLVSRIIIECDKRMMLWRRHDETAEAAGSPENFQKYSYTILKSCMVKATFPIDKLAMATKMLHLVKVAKTREIANIKELKKKSVISRSTKNPSKIREGLPEWVNYIPYRWYSASVRRVIEYMLMMYTILSLLWAMWQLYRHVDFIRAYLKPVVRIIEHYFSVLKVWFQWLDDVFLVLSGYWWKYLKPFLMLFVAAFAPLLQIFKPLRGIVNIIPYLFDPFIKFFNIVGMFLKPLFLPLKALYGIIAKLALTIASDFASYALANQTIANIIQRGSQFYIVKLIQEALHGHLDPLKAQVIVVRDLVFKSSRKIYYGVRFIITRIYFVIIFMRRERDYSKEGQAQVNANEPLISNEDETMKPKQD